MKKKRFYDYYCDFIELGSLPKYGLCNSLPWRLLRSKTWTKVKPTEDDIQMLYYLGQSSAFWGIGDFETNDYNYSIHALTPLRETILLLAACINEEY